VGSGRLRKTAAHARQPGRGVEKFGASGALSVLRKRNLDFDGVVKLLIQESGGEPFRQLQLGQVEKWLNVDIPTTQHRCVDLLCQTTDGRLVHIELQATNDRSMPYRMAEYALTIRRTFGKYPKQVVLYVGNKPLRMKAGFRTEGMRFQYRLVDVWDLDGAGVARQRVDCRQHPGDAREARRFG